MRRYWFVPMSAYRAYIRLSAARLRRKLKRDNATHQELVQLEEYKRDALSKWKGQHGPPWRAGR